MATTDPAPQLVKVRYRHQEGTKGYTYEWHGKDLLGAGDIVILPPTARSTTGQWNLGWVLADQVDHAPPNVARILYAIRGRFIR